jgi:outer membrane protein assembly factor BamB
MTASSSQALNCPTCGAPLEADGSNPVVRCEFCHNVILIDALKPGQVPETASDKARGVPEEILVLLKSNDLIKATRLYRELYDVSQTRALYAINQILSGNLLEPEAGFPKQGRQDIQVLTEHTTQLTKARKKVNLLGVILPISVLLIVAGFFALVLIQPGGPFVPRLNAYGPAVLLSPEQDGPADVVTQFYNGNDDNHLLGRVSTTQGKLLWQSSPFPKDSLADAVLTDGKLVFVANQDNLLALCKEDGSQVWQIKMPDKLYYGSSSLILKNDHLLAITQDRSLQAYNTQTGEQAWSRQLLGYDRDIRSMGSGVAILDYSTESSIYSLFLLDPATGNEILKITPSCQAPNSLENDLDPDSGILYDESTNSLLLIYGSFDGCIQRFDLQTGQLIWQYTQDDAFAYFMSGFYPAITESGIYFNSEDSLYTLDKQNGSVQLLLNNPDYEMTPLMLSGANLIVRARRTRGSERFELWGVNAASGARQWQLTLENSSPLDPPNEMVGLITSDGYGWTFHSLATGFLLLNFQAEPNQLVLKSINPADGTVLAENTLALRSVSGDFYSAPEVVGWRGNLLYFLLETQVYVLDVSTLKIVMQYQ